jgi:L-arabinose isomerase
VEGGGYIVINIPLLLVLLLKGAVSSGFLFLVWKREVLVRKYNNAVTRTNIWKILTHYRSAYQIPTTTDKANEANNRVKQQKICIMAQGS